MVHELVENRRAIRDGIARSFRRFKREHKLHGADAKLLLSIMPGMKPGFQVAKPTAANLLAEAREYAKLFEEPSGANPLDTEYYSACGWDDMRADQRRDARIRVLECYAAARSLGAEVDAELAAFCDREFLGLVA